MHRRARHTEAGWTLAKATVVAVLLGTLSAVTLLSHLVSHASAGRIACLDNLTSTSQALLLYQADHDGRSPRMLGAASESVNTEILRATDDLPAIGTRCGAPALPDADKELSRAA